MATAKFIVRQANASDLDDIVAVALAAMPMDPQWDYRFPRRQLYPEDTRDFTLLKYQEFLCSPQRWQIVLAEEASSLDRELKTDRRRVVAFAIWDISNLPLERRPAPVTLDCLPLHPRARRDADERRLAAWNAEMPRAKDTYFNKVYGSRHLHLQILATHPSWQRCGAGTMLCRWGLSIADARAMAVSVFASPMGRRLYEKLGFTITGEVLISVPGEQHSISVAALVFEPKSVRRRSVASVRAFQDGPLSAGTLIAQVA